MDFLNRDNSYTIFIDCIPSIFTLDDIRLWIQSYGSIIDLFIWTSANNYCDDLNNEPYETWAAGVKFYSQRSALLAKRYLNNKKPWEEKEFLTLYFPTIPIPMEPELVDNQVAPVTTSNEEPMETMENIETNNNNVMNNTLPIIISNENNSSSSTVSSSSPNHSKESLLTTSTASPEVAIETEEAIINNAASSMSDLPPMHTSKSEEIISETNSSLPTVFQTTYVPLRVWVGKSLREERPELSEPLPIADIVDMLNRYAPLQWSNTVEVCDVNRRCKKKELSQNTVGGFEALFNDPNFTKKESLQFINQQFPNILTPMIDLQDKADTNTENISTDQTGLLPFPMNAFNDIDEDSEFDDETNFFTGFDSDSTTSRVLKPIPPRVKAREDLIYANIQNNSQLGAISLPELTNKYHLRHMIHNTPHALQPTLLPNNKFFAVPHPQKPGTFTRPCVFVRQSIHFHNHDGTTITSTSAGGCSCRHRDDGQAVSTTKFVPPTEQSDVSVLGHTNVNMVIVPPPGKRGKPIITSVPPVGNPILPLQTIPTIFSGTIISKPAYDNYDDTLLPLSQQLSQVDSNVPNVPTYSISNIAASLTAALPDNHQPIPHRLRLRGSQKRQPWTALDIAMGKPIKLASTEAFRMATSRLCMQLSTTSTGPNLMYNENNNNPIPVQPIGQKRKRSMDNNDQ